MNYNEAQNFDTVWFWLVTYILEECATFICSVTNCLGGHFCGSRKEMSQLCRQVATTHEKKRERNLMPSKQEL